MPKIMEAKVGTLDQWFKKQGDSITVGETLCHVSIGDVTLGVESDIKGIFAQRKVAEGQNNVACGDTIAICVDTKEEYTAFLEAELREMKKITESLESNQKVSVPTPVAEKKVQAGADIKDLLREVKTLINNGKIEEESEFAKNLLSLARKGNSELLTVFEASFEEGKSFSNQEAFDSNFFLDNAKDIVKEFQKEQKKKDKS